MSEQPKFKLEDDGRLLVLTGAGVSAESGIATFRGGGGLWENHPVEQVASPEGFEANPTLVWRFYSERRVAAARCEPNPGHRALAKLEQQLGDRMLLVTQNIDGLHARAGSKRLIELHGNLFLSRCTGCARPPFEDRAAHATPPSCDHCGGMLRPQIVWFGEMLNPRELEQIERFMAGTPKLVFLAVGTSGAVWPAAGLVDWARRAGGTTWLVNADPAENAHRFHHFIQGKSGEVLPRLLEVG